MTLTCRCCRSSSCMFWERLYTWKHRHKHDMRYDVALCIFHQTGNACRLTCTELVIVLRANTVAQSFIVDWLSNAPWVSTRSTATCWNDTQLTLVHVSFTLISIYRKIKIRIQFPWLTTFESLMASRAWCLRTLLPSGLSITKTSLQTWIPVVSLSQPPLHVNPVRGSLSPPIHESLCIRGNQRGGKMRGKTNRRRDKD